MASEKNLVFGDSPLQAKSVDLISSNTSEDGVSREFSPQIQDCFSLESLSLAEMMERYKFDGNNPSIYRFGSQDFIKQKILYAAMELYGVYDFVGYLEPSFYKFLREKGISETEIQKLETDVMRKQKETICVLCGIEIETNQMQLHLRNVHDISSNSAFEAEKLRLESENNINMEDDSSNDSMDMTDLMPIELLSNNGSSNEGRNEPDIYKGNSSMPAEKERRTPNQCEFPRTVTIKRDTVDVDEVEAVDKGPTVTSGEDDINRTSKMHKYIPESETDKVNKCKIKGKERKETEQSMTESCDEVYVEMKKETDPDNMEYRPVAAADSNETRLENSEKGQSCVNMLANIVSQIPITGPVNSDNENMKKYRNIDLQSSVPQVSVVNVQLPDTDTDRKQIKCYLCNEVYLTEEAVWRHVKLSHMSLSHKQSSRNKSTKFYCSHCIGSNFNTFAELSRHERTTHFMGAACFVCGCSMNSLSNVLLHIEKHHAKTYVCICDMVCASADEYIEHISQTSHMQFDPEARVVYNCLLCDFKCAGGENSRWLGVYRQHVNTCTTLSSEMAKRKCESCKLKFLDEVALNFHQSRYATVLNHAPERSYISVLKIVKPKSQLAIKNKIIQKRIVEIKDGRPHYDASWFSASVWSLPQVLRNFMIDAVLKEIYYQNPEVLKNVISISKVIVTIKQICLKFPGFQKLVRSLEKNIFTTGCTAEHAKKTVETYVRKVYELGKGGAFTESNLLLIIEQFENREMTEKSLAMLTRQENSNTAMSIQRTVEAGNTIIINNQSGGTNSIVLGGPVNQIFLSGGMGLNCQTETQQSDQSVSGNPGLKCGQSGVHPVQNSQTVSFSPVVAGNQTKKQIIISPKTNLQAIKPKITTSLANVSIQGTTSPLVNVYAQGITTPVTNLPAQGITTHLANLPSQGIATHLANLPAPGITTPLTNLPAQGIATPLTNLPAQGIKTHQANLPGQNITSSLTNLQAQGIATHLANLPAQNITIPLTNLPVQDSTLSLANLPTQGIATHLANLPAQGITTPQANLPGQNITSSLTNLPTQGIATHLTNLPTQSITTPSTNLPAQSITTPSANISAQGLSQNSMFMLSNQIQSPIISGTLRSQNLVISPSVFALNQGSAPVIVPSVQTNGNTCVWNQQTAGAGNLTVQGSPFNVQSSGSSQNALSAFLRTTSITSAVTVASSVPSATTCPSQVKTTANWPEPRSAVAKHLDASHIQPKQTSNMAKAQSNNKMQNLVISPSVFALNQGSAPVIVPSVQTNGNKYVWNQQTAGAGNLTVKAAAFDVQCSGSSRNALSAFLRTTSITSTITPASSVSSAASCSSQVKTTANWPEPRSAVAKHLDASPIQPKQTSNSAKVQFFNLHPKKIQGHIAIQPKGAITATRIPVFIDPEAATKGTIKLIPVQMPVPKEHIGQEATLELDEDLVLLQPIEKTTTDSVVKKSRDEQQNHSKKRTKRRFKEHSKAKRRKIMLAATDLSEECSTEFKMNLRQRKSTPIYSEDFLDSLSDESDDEKKVDDEKVKDIDLENHEKSDHEWKPALQIRESSDEGEESDVPVKLVDTQITDNDTTSPSSDESGHSSCNTLPGLVPKTVNGKISNDSETTRGAKELLKQVLKKREKEEIIDCMAIESLSDISDSKETQTDREDKDEAETKDWVLLSLGELQKLANSEMKLKDSKITTGERSTSEIENQDGTKADALKSCEGDFNGVTKGARQRQVQGVLEPGLAKGSGRQDEELFEKYWSAYKLKKCFIRVERNSMAETMAALLKSASRKEVCASNHVEQCSESKAVSKPTLSTEVSADSDKCNDKIKSTFDSGKSSTEVSLGEAKCVTEVVENVTMTNIQPLQQDTSQSSQDVPSHPFGKLPIPGLEKTQVVKCYSEIPVTSVSEWMRLKNRKAVVTYQKEKEKRQQQTAVQENLLRSLQKKLNVKKLLYQKMVSKQVSQPRHLMPKPETVLSNQCITTVSGGIQPPSSSFSPSIVMPGMMQTGIHTLPVQVPLVLQQPHVQLQGSQGNLTNYILVQAKPVQQGTSSSTFPVTGPAMQPGTHLQK